MSNMFFIACTTTFVNHGVLLPLYVDMFCDFGSSVLLFATPVLVFINLETLGLVGQDSAGTPDFVRADFSVLNIRLGSKGTLANEGKIEESS